MEKIKHRTIRFSQKQRGRTAFTAALAGTILGAMAIALCMMIYFILS